MILLASAFEALEPRALLPGSPGALLRKWRRAALALHLFYLPGYLQGLIWQSSHLWLILYIAVALETLLLLAFFYKYAAWRSGLQRLSGNVYTFIGLLLILIPGGIAVALPLAGRVLYKALDRAKNNWTA